MRRAAILALVLALVAPAGLVAAKKKPKPKDGEVVLVFTDAQRETARGYFVEKHGKGKCPPGLAKKNNGCLPPGQAKKRYSIGRPLPAEVACDDLPWELSVRIGKPPEGYRYGTIDGDVVKLVVGTLLVVDAIEGLVE